MAARDTPWQIEETGDIPSKGPLGDSNPDASIAIDADMKGAKVLARDEAPDPINGLDANDTARVALFMEKVVRAFDVGDPFAIQALDHPGGDPRGEKNSFEFNKSLMQGGDKVVAWSARRYSEPKWDIMKLLRHHPTPTIWIDVTLNNGRADYPIVFACSPDNEGSLRSCYYVER